ncbi:ATP-binding protein [Magnetospirillum sp. SS-4]|uniref:sensor histidine kinase n=1 Tax=Magnetospirillum sp. SS-4 TaxID=2681465 RepID=UPI00137C9733|nr:ATP-binding protein [Magnetospirillum sp. SS-4]CAA7614277.1 Integral membrane sensor signal transduction histidine kinase [Magnetospirillum sp. SS-4]
MKHSFYEVFSWAVRPRKGAALFRAAGTSAVYVFAWIALFRAAIAMGAAPGVSAWFPPAGLTFAFLLRFPRLWPVAYVGVGYIVATAPYPHSAIAIFLSWVIPPTTYVVGVHALRRSLGYARIDLANMRHLIAFSIVSLLVPVVAALALIATFCADGLILWSNFWDMVLRFSLGDAIGIVTLTPILLLTRSDWVAAISGRSLIWLIASFAAIGLALYVETVAVILGQDQGPMSYFLMLPIAWTAMHFGNVGSSASSLIANISITLASWLAPDHRIVAGAPYFMLSVGYLGLIIGSMTSERERSVQKLRVQERALDRAYTHFTGQQTAAKLAHEIRQPLAVVSTYVEGLVGYIEKDTNRTDDALMLAKRTDREVQRIGEIISAAQSKIEHAAGKREIFDFASVMQDVDPLLRQICKDHGVTASFDVATSAQVSGIKASLQQVMVNFVRNACEAMSTTSPTDRHLMVESSHDDERINVTVSDTGMGLAEDLEKAGHALFASTKVGGSGFGLPISKTIIEGHGGALFIMNRPEGGAVISFWLPIVKADRS